MRALLVLLCGAFFAANSIVGFLPLPNGLLPASFLPASLCSTAVLLSPPMTVRNHNLDLHRLSQEGRIRPPAARGMFVSSLPIQGNASDWSRSLWLQLQRSGLPLTMLPAIGGENSEWGCRVSLMATRATTVVWCKGGNKQHFGSGRAARRTQAWQVRNYTL